MKLVSRISLIIILLFASVPVNSLYAAPGDGAPSEYGNNLMVNGAFETEKSGWGFWPPTDTFEVVDLASPPGNRVLKLHTDNIANQWGVSEAHQIVSPLEEHQPFSLSGDIFFESTVNAIVTIRIDFYNEQVPRPSAYISNLLVDINHPNGSFQPFTISGLIPKGARSSKVEFDIKAIQANAKGTVYVDNVKLQYQWAPTNLRETSKTETSITLGWDKPKFGDSYHYEIFNNGISLGESEDTTFTLAGLMPNTAHTFHVVAKMNDKVSLPSNTFRAATNKPDGTITIMPLGDSITKGVYPRGETPGGYRGYLDELMQSSDFNAQLIGSQNSNPATFENFDFDPDHEGHEGISTSGIAKQLIESQVFVYAPDYILFHAGTNDMWSANNNAAGNMKSMLKDITDRLTSTYVIVASIPGIYEPNVELLPRVKAYNDALKGVVQELRGEGRKVGFVDMGAMLTEQYIAVEGGDLIHPNAEGYKVMAEIWYDALDAVIDPDSHDVSGMFPEAPVLNAELSEDYITAQLTWQAVSDNVGVDRYEIYQDDSKISVTDATYANVTGLASSTTYSFSVEAIDKAGNRSRSNSVSLVTPAKPDPNPPTAPTELTVIDAKHDSIRLSWSPGTDDIGISGYEITFNGTSSTVSSAVYGDFELTGLTPDTAYNIAVKTIDIAGNKSEGSEPLSVETKAAPPSELRVKSKSMTSITLKWNEATDKDGIEGYRINRDDLPAEITKETFYSFSGLTYGQEYTFKVAAIDKLGHETAPSISKMTLLFESPLGLALKDEPTWNAIPIRWSSVDGAIGYKVYVDNVLRTTTSGTEYQIEGLTQNTEYAIAVKSVFGDEAGLESDTSVALIVKTKVMPEPQVSTGPFYFPVAPSDLKEYSETDKGIKLRFVPNVDETKKKLNGADDRLVLSILSDKPFDMLGLELSGELLKLAADKKKSIEIRMGSLSLELPPGWLKAEGKDSVTLLIAARSLEKDKSASKQSLMPLSSAFDFEVQLNGAKVTAFPQPVKLKVSTEDMYPDELSGVYLMDESTGTWTYQGGSFNSSGEVMLELSHFSEYAVFARMKTFTDIANHWARTDIEALAAKQIVFGLTNDLFGPSGEVKRAEFAVMLARAYKLEADEGKLPFEDVSELAWYHDGIKAAYQAGWIQGISKTEFAPNDRITREQMAVMIMKAYQYSKKDSLTKEEQTNELPFKDAADISDWATEYVRQAYGQELISGMDGSFMPRLYADRAQAAAMINRLLKLSI